MEAPPFCQPRIPCILASGLRCRPFARRLRYPFRLHRLTAKGVGSFHFKPQHRKPQQLQHVGPACPRLLKSA